MSNKIVEFGPIAAFDEGAIHADKTQVVKILEEAAEVYSAWEAYDRIPQGDFNSFEYLTRKRHIFDECCDVVQAVANLCAALDYSDMSDFMRECTQRNIDRGRITKL